MSNDFLAKVIEIFLDTLKILTIIFLICFFVFELFEKFYHLTGLPNRLGRLFDERARQQARDVLEKMGITVRMAKRLNIALNYEEAILLPPNGNYRGHCRKLLQSCLFQGDYVVGQQGYLRQKEFLDVLSASLEDEKCTRLAGFLHELYKEAIKEYPQLATASTIVGIKRGSPSLAYEFAKRLNMPLVLHRGSSEFRYNVEQRLPKDTFDGDLPKEGNKVLIIDDSTTGGRMLIDAIRDLRKQQVEVEYCLLLFEVLGKDGRQALRDNHVELISLFRFDGANKILEDVPIGHSHAAEGLSHAATV